MEIPEPISKLTTKGILRAIGERKVGFVRVGVCVRR